VPDRSQWRSKGLCPDRTQWRSKALPDHTQWGALVSGASVPRAKRKLEGSVRVVRGWVNQNSYGETNNNRKTSKSKFFLYKCLFLPFSSASLLKLVSAFGGGCYGPRAQL